MLVRDPHIEGASRYRVTVYANNQSPTKAGVLTYSHSASENGFTIASRKSIAMPSTNIDELFETHYAPDLSIERISSKGRMNGTDFELIGDVSKKEIDLRADIGGSKKRIAVDKPPHFVDNNTFPYILPLYFDKPWFRIHSFYLFVPASGTFVECGLSVFPQEEEVPVSGKNILCQRLKIQAVASESVYQYFLYECLTSRLVKGSSAAQQSFELEK